MATEKEASLQSCASDPNFAVICSFLNQFAASCGIAHPTFSDLQEMLEDTEEVSQVLIDLHIKLLRKARKSFTADKWEKALAKFCHTYSQQDGWELERFGYKKARLGVKVKLLKVLLETQFDVNGKFKSEVNKVGAKDLRLEPLGRDQNGFQYWCQFDKSSHVRIYREDLDDETWEMVASDRDGLVQLIDSLSNGEGQQELNSILNEDSTSQEIEKPITDTGQEDDKLEEGVDGDDEGGDEEEEEEEVEEEEEEVEEGEEEEEEEEEGDDEEDVKEENKVEKEVEKKAEQKAEPVPAKPVVAVQEQEKPVELTNGSNVVPPPEENVSSLTGVDLSIKSDSKRYLPAPNDYYTSVPERPYMPERNDILSQMSARFNDPREAEDLSFSPAKKLRLEDDDQPMMLVKKDIVVSDAIEEPVRLVTGPGSGEDCQQGNPSKEPEFSEVIEEPVQYVVEIGSGVDCDAPNPKYGRNLDVRNLEDEESAVEEEPEFSEVIEEPVLFIVGLGSGVECEIGNPRPCNEGETSSSYSASTLGIECSLKTLSLASREPKFSDVIEEPVMFVHGSGSGQDCLTGNPDEVDESIDDKSPEKKPKLWSIDAICSSEKLLNESLKQNSSGSSQKDPECDEGSSKMSEGALNCTKENVADEENGSAFNLSNNINSSLKPFSGVKPILENIPMKDKPPDDTEPDTSNLVPEISNDISSRNFDKIEGNSNCMSNIEEEAGSNRALTSESIPPSARVEDLNDVSSSNCTSEEKSTEGDQPSATNCTVNSCLLPASTECDLKSLSEDNSRTSMISEDSVEDKNSSELNDGLSKLDNDSCHNVNNAKSNSKKSSSTKSSKITTDSNNKKSTADDGEVKCDINNSLSEKCESDDQVNSLIVDKNNLENCENGSKLMSNCSVVLTDISLPDQNLSASKTSKHKSSTVSSSGNDELKTDSDKSNPASSDKNEEKRKNVMLTNIIEVCLDNDNYGKDDAKSGLKGQLNAKFNDLFSAKNLLEPTTRSISKETCNELKEVPTSDISENCTKSDSSDEKIKAQEEQKINPDVNIKDENCENIKQEENINEEASQDVSTSKPESEDKIQSENCDPVKQEEVKEENSVRNVARGRKSRTNSLNNDEETEIPNKIRKTDSVPKARRVTRRNASSNSLNSVSSEPTDDKVVNVKESKTKAKNDSNTEKEPVNEVNLNEEKTENKTEQKDQNNEAVDDEVKVKEEEKKDEATKEIPKTVTDETDHISNQENEGIEKKNIQENKGFTLASFSLEQPLEDGPVLGKPPDFKSQPTSRKRRNSRKLSRSEEDGGEGDDKEEDVEEAGGKKPRLRAKTRRSKGTPPSTKHVQPEASSSDDNQAEENTDLNSKDKRRPKGGRPIKKKGKNDTSATSKSKPGKAKESEKNKEKGSDSEDEDESESEKEDAKQIPAKKGTKTKETDKEESEKEEKKQPANEKADKKQIPKKGAKSKSKGKGRFNKGGRPKKEPQSNKEETAGDDTSNGAGEDVEEGKDTKTEAVESKGEEDNDSKSAETEEPKPKKKGRPKKQKTLLGLMESDLIHSKPSPNDSEEGSRVRQSRRIAQIKIKEEAERRAIEEATMMLTMKEAKKKPKEESKLTPKKQKQKKKNGKKEKVSEEEDETFKEPVEDKKKGRKKKKKKGLTYDINKPWQSSSDDSSEEAEEEEEHFEEEDDEEDIRASKVVSDHEFSPESDLEKDDTIEPVRRARTAKKADEDEIKDEETEVTEDYACKKCGQPDHPEWILLCDKCDSGYHASCLRPTLMLIPEGDWFCPPCQHLELVSKLKETLRAFEKNTKRRENEELRKKRLAYVGISLANVLPTQDKTSPYSGGRRIMSESSESSSEESESSDEEPVYQLRQRRAALQANYRFNDYDELINSAIQDEMEAVKGAGNMGRGKDIANIVEAEKKAAQSEEAENAEEEPKPEEEEEQGENWRPPVVPKNTSLPSLRKKPKKLTDLDKQSEDDADSDEDFKGSSDDEEFSSTEGGDSDDSLGRRQPVRRSSRARTSRIDKEFINDDSESSDEPRRKKTRRIWASSSSESSDTTWGRRKRKTKTYSRIRSSKSSRKKKKMVFDSDSDRPKKTKTKRPKIRYGLSEDEGEPLRRTRGKKMSYLEVAGSDTEEEVIARSRKLISEDEDEFVPEKEEAGDDEPEEVEPVEEVEEEEEEDDDDENEEEEEDEADEPKAEEKDKVEIEKKENEKNEEKPPEKETVKVPVPPVPETQNKDAVKEPEPVQEIEPEKTVEEEDDDDQVEEEEIEEEVEEEVEEEEEEEEEDDDSQIDEVKNLAREKVEEPKGIIQPPIKIGSGISIIKVPLAPAVSTANSTSTVPPPAPPAAAAIPTPVIKEEKKEEKKEPTPAIRLVPSAKLLDPNKRRPPEESVIRGMLGGGYYRPPPMQAPGRQPFRQRFPDQQRYLYQPPPASHHQFFPGSAFYASEDYVVGSGYEEQVDPNAPGGDEEGVFSGLVSYFSSQREDNLDS